MNNPDACLKAALACMVESLTLQDLSADPAVVDAMRENAYLHLRRAAVAKLESKPVPA